jgi:hypothetical protein
MLCACRCLILLLRVVFFTCFCCVYFSDLGCCADALRAYFSQYGDVQEAVIAVDPATGRTRGFGFITIGAWRS